MSDKPKCKHDELDLCKNCCHEDHFEGEDECIICSYEDSGGNWRRWIFCSWLRHDWIGVYSWWIYCQRCLRHRHPKGFSMVPLGDGFAVG